MRLVVRLQELRRCVLDPWGGYIIQHFRVCQAQGPDRILARLTPCLESSKIEAAILNSRTRIICQVLPFKITTLEYRTAYQTYKNTQWLMFLGSTYRIDISTYQVSVWTGWTNILHIADCMGDKLKIGV